MPQKSVLAIGVDPAFADYSKMPGLTPELVRAYIDAEIGRLAALGYEVENCLIDPASGGEAAVEAALRATRFDCVLIGAGLREPPERLLLFERLINLVHEHAPGSRIAFNSNPADTAEAARRQLG